MPSFNAISRRSTPEIVLLRKNLNSASKVTNWIIVSIFFIHLILSLANSFLLEMMIAKDHYRSLQYFTYSVSI